MNHMQQMRRDYARGETPTWWTVFTVGAIAYWFFSDWFWNLFY